MPKRIQGTSNNVQRMSNNIHRSIVLHCPALSCIVLHCPALFCIVLHCPELVESWYVALEDWKSYVHPYKPVFLNGYTPSVIYPENGDKINPAIGSRSSQ